MRGVRVLSETRSSRYVCPSCRWRTAGGLERTKGASSRKSRQYFPRIWPSQHFSNGIDGHRLQLTTVRGFSSADGSTTMEPAKPETPLHAVLPDASKDTGGNRSHLEEEVFEILEEAQPARVLTAFTNPAYTQVFARLPPTTFMEALRLMSPSYFIEPYKEIYARAIPLRFSGQAKYLRSIFQLMSFYIPKFVALRRKAGWQPGLAEYTHLLDCARAMGSLELATRIWADMLDDKIDPSAECYNYYIEALVWHNSYYAPDNHTNRSTRFNYRKRSYEERIQGYRGFRTGPGGTRSRVRELFREMVAKGLQPDTATLIQCMTADAREWDLEAVHRTLIRTWGVRPDLLAPNSENHPSPLKYPKSSPLHPTADLLVALAHIYGSNNDVPMALRVVDFFSRNYEIPVPERAWEEILNRSFVVAGDKFRPTTTIKNPELGLSAKTAIGVYESLREEPYNLPASVRRLDLLIKLRWYQKTWTKILNEMRAGRDLFFKSISERNDAQDRLESVILRTHPEVAHGFKPRRLSYAKIGQDWALLYPSSTSEGAHWQAYHEFELKHMKVLAESKLVERWVNLMRTQRGWRDIDLYPRERRYIPDMVNEWKDFISEPFRYPTSGGLVEIKCSSGETRPAVYQVRLRNPALRAHYLARHGNRNRRVLEPQFPAAGRKRGVWKRIPTQSQRTS